MLLTLQRYDLKIVYKPGTELFIADALSRNYLEEMKETLVPELEVSDVDLTVYLPISPEMYQDRTGHVKMKFFVMMASSSKETN